MIKTGKGIIAATQSGNRDDDVFPEADTFNLHRKRGPEKALGFGFGEHQCVAESLARAELEIVFGKSFPCLSGVSLHYGVTSVTDVGGWDFLATLFQKLPNLKLMIPFEEVKYSPLTKDVGITELPVAF